MQNEPALIDPAVLDTVVLLICSLRDRRAVAAAVIEKLGVSPSEVHVVIAEAFEKVRQAAKWSADETLGQAVLRLTDIYERSLRVSDLKSALSAQKELNRLQNTYAAARRRPAAPMMEASK